MIHFAFTAKSKLSLSCMLFLLTLASADFHYFYLYPAEYVIGNCSGNDIKNGSALERNLKLVLNSLVQNVNKTGYSVSQHGENGDKMYGRAQCRGDLNASACRACVANATTYLRGYCRKISGMIGYVGEGCFLRYDTHNFYSYSQLKVNFSDPYGGWGLCSNYTTLDTRITDPLQQSQFDMLVTRVTDKARSSKVGYGTESENGFYSLAQCWSDLNTTQCNLCLNAQYEYFSGGCPKGTKEIFSVNDHCMIDLRKYKFYGDGVPLLSPLTGSGPSGRSGSGPSSGGSSMGTKVKKSLNLPLMLGLIIAGVFIAVVLVGFVLNWKRKYKRQLPSCYNKSLCALSIAISKSKLNYKFEILQNATKNFDPTNKIGQGGFGSVYKGVIPDGREIAVKRALSNKEQSVHEFFNEVDLISCVQHKNLVKLLGCSVDGPDKLLVYEYIPNKSLDHFLFSENLGNILDWRRRFEIILGIASGLAYLHQESDIRIIHRDIKASNILLDHHFKPKIADFGLVRHFSEDETHLSTRIIGTRGYMAPEYLVHGHLTEKVDVYAFGVLVLEIISGRRNKTPMHTNDTPSLLTMVWKCHLSSTISSIIDPNIQENYQEEVFQVVHIALLCTQTSAILRPSMSEVIMLLTNKEPNLLKVSQPPFIDTIHLHSNINTSVASIHLNSNNRSVSPAYNPIPKNCFSSITPLSLNTISTNSFGPR